MYNKEKGSKKFISNEERAKRREESNKKKKRDLDTIYNMCKFISDKLDEDLDLIKSESKVSKFVNNTKLDEYLKENGADDELLKAIRPFRFLVAELFTTYHLGFIKSVYRYDVRVLYIRERLDSMFGHRFSDDIDKIIDTLSIFSVYKDLYTVDEEIANEADNEVLENA